MQPMRFGEIYSYTFWLIRQTIGPTFLALFALLIFLCLTSYGGLMTLDRSISLLETMQGMDLSTADPTSLLGRQIGVLIPVAITVIALVAAFVHTHVLVGAAGWGAATAETRTIPDLVGTALGQPFWKGLLQMLILGVLGGAAALVVLILVSAASGGDPVRSAGLGTAATWLLLLLAFFAYIASITKVLLITVEERGPWRSFTASIALGRGQFWRNVGLVLLPLLVLVVATVIYYLVAAPQNQPVTLDSSNPALQIEQALTQLRQQRADFSWGQTIVSNVLVSAVLIFIFHLVTAIYIDLRARRGDFLVEGESGDEDAPTPGDTTINW